MATDKQNQFIVTFQSLLLAHRVRYHNDDSNPLHKEYSNLGNMAYQMGRAFTTVDSIPDDMTAHDAAHYVFWQHMDEIGGCDE
jgi:hypothetical protein